jgi:hypothetical protein
MSKGRLTSQFGTEVTMLAIFEGYRHTVIISTNYRILPVLAVLRVR